MFEGHHLFCLTSYNPYLGVGGNSPITMSKITLDCRNNMCQSSWVFEAFKSYGGLVWGGRWGIGHPVCIIQYIYMTQVLLFSISQLITYQCCSYTGLVSTWGLLDSVLGCFTELSTKSTEPLVACFLLHQQQVVRRKSYTVSLRVLL